jgi:hypothetical protein
MIYFSTPHKHEDESDIVIGDLHNILNISSDNENRSIIRQRELSPSPLQEAWVVKVHETMLKCSPIQALRRF